MRDNDVLKYLNPMILIAWLGSLFFVEGEKITTILVIVLACYNFYKLKNKEILKKYFEENKNIILGMVVFLFANIISVLFSGHSAENFGFLFDTIKYSLFVFIPIMLVNDSIKLKRSIFLMCILTTIFSLYCIYGYYVLNIPRGVGSAVNLYAWILICLTPFTVIGFMMYSKWKNYYVVLLVLNVLSLILTQSRACWVAFIFSVVIIFVIERKKLNIKMLYLPVALIAISSMFVLPVIQKRIEFTKNYNSNYTVERFYIWQSTLTISSEHILTGIGLEKDKFKNLYNKKYQLEESKERNIMHPHNVFLYFLVRTGLIGLSAFVLFLISQFCFFKKQYKLNNEKINLIAIAGIWFLLVTVASQMFDSNFYFIKMQKCYWGLLGFFMAAIFVLKNSIVPSKNILNKN